MGQVITFYSYKGGVGRTFALANIGVALSAMGKRVLLMDWDLEAPGLEYYFKNSPKWKQLPEDIGILPLLEDSRSTDFPDWKKHVVTVSMKNDVSIDIVTSGSQTPNYADRLRVFSWEDFFAKSKRGPVLERLRDEWTRDYDFVLIDSRTGVTDVGGICTILLPDILVVVFTTSDQGIDGIISVIEAARCEREVLGVPRADLAVLPILSRFEGSVEVDLSDDWLEKCARRFKPYFDVWLEQPFVDTIKHFLGATRIPHVAKYTFGEPLAVLENDWQPDLAGRYLKIHAELLANLLDDALRVADLPQPASEEAVKLEPSSHRTSLFDSSEFQRRRHLSSDSFEFDVFVSYSSQDKAWVRGELLPQIEQAGVKACIDFRDFARGAPYTLEMERGIVKSLKTLLVLTPNYVASEWTKIEATAIQVLNPSNREVRLIPLLKAECQKPLHIAALTQIDFTDGADQTLAWRQLLTALGKPPEPEPPQDPRRDQWFLAHPYPMPPNFTGRVAERAMLDRWLNEDPAHPLLSLRALGGFGKSALVWHWLTHDVPPAVWPRVVWWSFYENDASFDQFLEESLRYLSGVKIDAAKLTAKDAVKALVQALYDPGTLLVLDGFERMLRAFDGVDAAYQGDEEIARSQRSVVSDRDCISPLAELFLYNVALQPWLRSKVLLTTRLSPRVLEAKGGGLLEGCRDEPLDRMQPADAVEFFHAQGIRGTHTEIETACAPYGYHPLSLRLLANLIVRDFQQPGDIAVAKRLDVSGDLVQRQHHVLETAYESLAPSRRALLGRIACFRSPVSYVTLKTLAETEVTFDADLYDLVARGMLHQHAKERRFDLHPIVRRYVYDRLAVPDRAAIHLRLRDYFAAVPMPGKVTRLEDLAPVIELYHHTVRAGQLDEAWILFRDRIWQPLYYQLGGYLLQIDLLRPLFPDGEDRPPRLKGESHQAHALSELANSYGLSGQPRRAVPLFEQVNAIREKQGDKSNLAIGLEAVASVALLPIGALRAAEANLRRSIALCREIKDEFVEAVGHAELGRLLAYRGADAESETELATALTMFEKEKHVHWQGLTCSYRALRELRRLRTAANLKSEIPDLKSPLASARRALELADEWARTDYPIEREYVRAHWLLGVARRVAGQGDEAERHLHEALQRCRRINLVEVEADILIDLARVRASIGAADEAQRLADEALLIADRSGFVLQGADAHLVLARLALARGDKAAAREHAEESHRLATCDGPPDYTYHAAYTESAALLAQLRNPQD